MKTIKGYKFILDDMTSKNGNIKWVLNKWQKHNGEIKLCEAGFHACRSPLKCCESYNYGDRFFIIEARGDFKEEKGDKFVSSEMRLIKELPIKKIAVRFACACAKECLKNYEKLNPNDKRPSEAIQAAEDYMDNKIDLKELNNKLSAARSAARSAAWSAAWSVAWSAARSAARSAAWSAAWSVAWSAAESAARKRHEKLFLRIIKQAIKENWTI